METPTARFTCCQLNIYQIHMEFPSAGMCLWQVINSQGIETQSQRGINAKLLHFSSAVQPQLKHLI